MVLSLDCVLVYVLGGSGVKGRLTSGRIELDEREGLRVYGDSGSLNHYISGARLRSWRVFCKGTPLAGWDHVMPVDADRLASDTFCA
jgi:hypothetical protein